MGGKVLRLRTDVILEQGIQQGKLQAYIELIKDGLLTIAIAAGRLGMSEEELKKHIS